MYIDYKLKQKLRKKYRREYNQLIYIYKQWLDLEPDLEFYLYEDFNLDKPNNLYYRLDILNDTRCLFSKGFIQFKKLVEYFKDVNRIVKDRNS